MCKKSNFLKLSLCAFWLIIHKKITISVLLQNLEKNRFLKKIENLRYVPDVYHINILCHMVAYNTKIKIIIFRIFLKLYYVLDIAVPDVAKNAFLQNESGYFRSSPSAIFEVFLQ